MTWEEIRGKEGVKMKRILLPILVIGSLLLMACAPQTEAPPTQQPTLTIYTLSVSVSPSGAGSVSPSNGRYEEGTQVTLTAIPSSGYTFDYWGGDASGSSATITITMASDKSVTAHFKTVDTTPPVISGVRVSDITETSATITWTTDEPATSQVEYDTTSAYGLSSALDTTLVTSHSISLSGLEPNTTYHFRVKAKDKAGNEALSVDYTFTTSKVATKVGGIISQSTRWTKENSPYVVTHTVQIPSGVTLTIEPGVTISMPSAGDMFLLHGTISARGASQDKIIFDGGGNSNFFSAKGSSSDTFLDLAYCIVRNGISFWPPTGHEQYGYFSLRHSELTNLTGYSYIWYPGRDIYIEYNKFINAGGFSIGHRGDVKVYIRYNLFDKKNPGLPHFADFWIQNWASYDSSATIVKYNSFINTEGIVLKLPSGYDRAAMSATKNYWGTQDTRIIDTMIYDKNDDITCAGYIDYLPILTEPHPSTP
jgi:uncharacterized repeat protein (TIGR02543 family)